MNTKLGNVLVGVIVLALPMFLVLPAIAEEGRLETELNRKFPSNQLLEDVDFTVTKLLHKKAGRNPFIFMNQQAFNDRLNSLKKEIVQKQSMTRREFYGLLGPLVTMVKDDHAELSLNGTWWNYSMVQRGFHDKWILPLSVAVINRKCFIVGSNSLPLKSELRTIGGVPTIDVILRSLRHSNFSKHHGLLSGKALLFHFYQYFNEIWNEFEFSNQVVVEFVPPNSLESVTQKIDLVDQPSIESMRRSMGYALKKQRNVSYSFFDDVAVLKINSMDLRKDLDGLIKEWLDFYRKFFGEVKKRGARYLVIDFSINNGGNELVSYMLLNSIHDGILKSKGESKGLTPQEILNKLIFKERTDIAFEDYSQDRFDGDLVLLISDRTFSSASKFADLFKTFKLGTIIGREPRAFRSHYGEMKHTYLPHTGLSFSVSSNFFFSKSGDLKPHGVQPDIDIGLTGIDDFIALYNGDLLLNAALEHIRKKEGK